MKHYEFTSGNGISSRKASELGKTLSNGGIVLSDNLTAFAKSGKHYPLFTP